MTPALFDLPLRLSDAVAVASVMIDVLGAQPKTLTDELRIRVGSRLTPVRFESMHPHPASIERDPVHSSAYYICVDGIEDQPLLLRVATSSTPSSGLFPKALLIGRTHIGSREVVLNAVPFGPTDTERIMTFAEQVNKAFLPRPSGKCPFDPISTLDPQAGFAYCHELLKATGKNHASFVSSDRSGFIWAAIRTGWRAGFVIGEESQRT